MYLLTCFFGKVGICLKTQDIIIRDPFILPYQGRYYMYGTRSHTCWGDHAVGVDVYISELWTEPAEVFHRPENFWADRHFWAPEVHIYKEKFYMFMTMEGPDGKKGTGILRADAPCGPFKAFGADIITPEDWSSLDGTFYLSPEGIPYMVFCHEWTQIGDGQVCAIRLKSDLSGPDGSPEILFCASEAPWAKMVGGWYENMPTGYVTDGPFMLRTEDGRLHMLWSSFGEGGYVQALAHSDNDDIDGHWVVDHHLLFEKDGGHGMIFKGFDGIYRLVLHCPNTSYHEHPTFYPLEYSNQAGVVTIQMP